MEPWQERVVQEYHDLSEKIDKLSAFIVSEKFSELTDHEQQLLIIQQGVMIPYATILELRLRQYASIGVTGVTCN